MVARAIVKRRKMLKRFRRQMEQSLARMLENPKLRVPIDLQREVGRSWDQVRDSDVMLSFTVIRGRVDAP